MATRRVKDDLVDAVERLRDWASVESVPAQDEFDVILDDLERCAGHRQAGKTAAASAAVGAYGRWVGGANPDAHFHRCEPPMRHVGCCDGTGGYTITEDDVRRSEEIPGLPPSMPAGTRTVCISGRPDGSVGAVWVCHCGQGWTIGAACDVGWHYGEKDHSYGHHVIGGGICVVGEKWRRLSRWATWRAKRRVRRRIR